MHSHSTCSHDLSRASYNPTSSTKPSLTPASSTFPSHSPALYSDLVPYCTQKRSSVCTGHLRHGMKQRRLKEPQKLGLNPAMQRQQQRGSLGKLPPCSAPQLLACRIEMNAHLLGFSPHSLSLLLGTHVTRTVSCSQRELNPCLLND